jgi:NADH:ubiquinone oxidoreductase subunit 5 (subunit L)/multisubunit Na+/H+ antiporter MnhA subunit
MYAGAWRGAPERIARTFPALYGFTRDKFRVDELYDLFVIKPLRGIAWGLWRFVDTILVDGTVNLVAAVAAALARAFRLVQNGDAQRYAALMAIAAAAILWSVLGMGGR